MPCLPYDDDLQEVSYIFLFCLFFCLPFILETQVLSLVVQGSGVNKRWNIEQPWEERGFDQAV